MRSGTRYPARRGVAPAGETFGILVRLRTSAREPDPRAARSRAMTEATVCPRARESGRFHPLRAPPTPSPAGVLMSHIEKPATEARQGEKSGVVRYVLAASLALVVIAFAVIYFAA